MPRKTPPLKLVTGSPKRRPPVEHHWSDADLELFGPRYWRLPRPAVEGGLLARVWDDGSTRGYSGASSVLPVLALHAWLKQAADEWTPFVALSIRRISALAGIDKNTVSTSLDRLRGLALVETRIGEPHPRDGGKGRLEYRMHRSLFPSGEREQFARVTGELIYGGHWAMLPKAAARHLLLAVMGLDPVLDEAMLAEWMEQEGRGESVADTLARRRHAESEATLGRLVELTGLASSTARLALDVLTRPIKNHQPLVLSTDARRGRVYYFNAHQLDWRWSAKLLNDRPARRQTVQDVWGSVLGRAA